MLSVIFGKAGEETVVIIGKNVKIFLGLQAISLDRRLPACHESGRMLFVSRAGKMPAILRSQAGKMPAVPGCSQVNFLLDIDGSYNITRYTGPFLVC